MDTLTQQFLSEARDNLSYLDQHLGELEKGDKETINALFRAAHTLKGGAGMVGFVSVKEITHKAEDLLDAYRNEKIVFVPQMIDALYDAFDDVVELIDEAESKGEFPTLSKERIEEITTGISSFLQNREDNEDDKSLTQLQIVDEIPPFVESLFIEDIADFVDSLSFETPIVDQAFLDEKHYFLIEMDLDRQTIEFGNDPFYLLTLLGEENIYAIVAQPPNECEDVIKSPLSWQTRILFVVEADAQTIEDALYNIIDEVNLYPLSLKVLVGDFSKFQNSSFSKRFQELFQESEIENLTEKFNTFKDEYSHKSSEYAFCKRISTLFDFIVSDEKKELLLNYILDSFTVSPEQKENPASISKNSLSQKEREISADILQQQKQILTRNGCDATLDRTRKIVDRVYGYIEKDKIDGDINAQIDHALNFLDSSKENIVAAKEQITQKSPAKSIKVDKETTSLKSGTHIPKTVKINQEDIDLLLNSIGELLVMKNALPYIAHEVGEISDDQMRREILGKYEEISRVTEQLQEKIMNMRLLPLSYIFGRYPKMVRDIGKKLGKKIRYEESGGETKLDKTMIEKLADPLIHLIRNSLDHGLESQEERIEAGKDPIGTIKIEARSQGDRVFITIEDDGRGIDVDKVVIKALEKRLINPDTIDTLSKDEKLMLIFHPGLSTKDEISDLSGRGVGADAVKKTIEELGGKIVLKSYPKKGTILTMELPVSVALSSVFHIEMNRNNYAIDMDRIVETVKVEREEILTAGHRPFINLRGKLIPLVYENALLAKETQNASLQKIVVIEGENESRFGLVVDDFVNQLDVVQKPLPGSLKHHPLISGTSLLGNGDVLFILDPLRLIALDSGGQI